MENELAHEEVESPDYELSENQKLFVREAEEQGFKVYYGYSGRGMFGTCCPAVNLDQGERLGGKSKVCTDGMGLGTVVYARY